ncbi:type VII secretion protein EccB [Longispora albida]|uniref:type VII secretion protein EccB n=1 Tax=Longispora albida TaxID=203523 RepID=UPI00037F3553|nr:type VII secretion protein EccB [Longispora albida]
MRTRRDQVQAYRFVTRRLVSAMLSGEPETTNLPLRRLFLSAVGSIMIATLVVAGVGVFGLMNPGGNERWKKDMTLVIEKESGARYIYAQGKLFPVVNYASARLIAGNAKPVQESASRKSLEGTPRGRPVGIEGAPDALPDPKALMGLPWTVCSAAKVASTDQQATHLVIGSSLPGGSPLGAEGLLVTSGSTTYLLWGDRRLRIPERSALTALNLNASAAIPVGPALIEGATAGPDLAALAVPGAGTASDKKLGGAAATVGKVYRSGTQHYVMLREGLAGISEVSAKLLGADGVNPVEISAADAAAVLTDTRIEPDGLPQTPPKQRVLEGGQPAVCAAYRGNKDKPVTVELYAQAPEQFTSQAQDQAVVTGRDSVRTADRIVVQGGHGALVQEQPAPGIAAGGGTLYLITDQGMKFALGDGAVGALGYGDAKPVPVPASLLALVPTGPALDPEAAKGAVGGGTPSSTPGVAVLPSPSQIQSGKPSPGTSPAKPGTASPKRS